MSVFQKMKEIDSNAKLDGPGSSNLDDSLKKSPGGNPMNGKVLDLDVKPINMQNKSHFDLNMGNNEAIKEESKEEDSSLANKRAFSLMKQNSNSGAMKKSEKDDSSSLIKNEKSSQKASSEKN
eukprot:CAMPEP_0114578230 /NCGR_PEP_ID=MMETSP0125-20121206/2797_1 /TAXON_ID=485358 ORGANISM="Aristerostoma sp., Strain ATCC 50986" /NCGR_SAMPLE_ID=MMETSP0125 /ASSEMBLY_ACC=CAM_ASM_000245 /LENGTH=122 /DNA_ID=CAMNT_0001768147 /DNA_START=2339 /DNA_END=2707 /DNA_ORIENTATION=-